MNWPLELDAATAAPKHHRLLLENDQVRVLETIVQPGEIVPLHTHRWPAVYYYKSWSDVVRRGPGGEVKVDTRGKPPPPIGGATWAGPLGPHTLENVGTGVLHVVSMELKGGSKANVQHPTINFQRPLTESIKPLLRKVTKRTKGLIDPHPWLTSLPFVKCLGPFLDVEGSTLSVESRAKRYSSAAISATERS